MQKHAIIFFLTQAGKRGRGRRGLYLLLFMVIKIGKIANNGQMEKNI